MTGVTAGTGLTGGTIVTSGTLALANTAVTAGAYTRANVTVDAQGRLTAASNGAAINLASEVTGTLGNVSTTGTAANTINTLVLRDGSGNFTAGTITATNFSGGGVNLTALNASNLTSGTVAAARLPVMVGDTGAGGTAGAAPAPAAGDNAAGKFLKANGTWAVPPTGGGPTGVVKITGAYAVSTTERFLIVTVATPTITLPAPASNVGRVLTILTSNNGFTLAGGNIRDGNVGSGYGTTVATAPYPAVNWWPIDCVSDGTNWYCN